MYYLSNQKVIRVVFKHKWNKWLENGISRFSRNCIAAETLGAYLNKIIETMLNISALAHVFLVSLPYDNCYWNVWFIL